MLKKWTKQLAGCRRFLDNFFGTCHGYRVEVNYLNYLVDLALYAPTNLAIKEHKAELVEAFYEITGTKAEELVDGVKRYYRWSVK